MKKIVGLMLGVALTCGIGVNAVKVASAQTPQETVSVSVDGIKTQAKAAFLMEYGTKTPLYSQNERARLPIASMCKLMTLLLSFEGIARGELDMDEEVCISERAASMGGSQVFLEANAKYSTRELLKSIVVCSANDSCVAMAERLAGSEALFVEKMNEKAKLLGANDTLFANCTGLPKEPQYSCARDVALMLQAVLQHPAYFEFGKVWTDTFQHPKGRYTEITNTNKLVRFYDGCDGGKTGFTNEAGFCLAATAKRGNMRVISVVIGEETSQNRFNDVRTMFDYAFANYTVKPIFEANEPLEEKLQVRGGKRVQVAVYPERTAYAFSKKGETPQITAQTRLREVKAPLEKGVTVGELLLFKDGVEIERIPLLAAESVEKANLWDRLRDVGKSWNAR